MRDMRDELLKLDLIRGRLTRDVASEPFLARLQELLRPTKVKVLIHSSAMLSWPRRPSSTMRIFSSADGVGFKLIAASRRTGTP